MGTLIGHVIPGAGFALIGVWHLFNVIRRFLDDPQNFRTRPWFPTTFSGEWKFLELYAIIYGALLHMASELIIFPANHHPFEADGSIAVNHLNNFEHASMSLYFFIYGMMALSSDAKNKFSLPHGMLNIFAAAALFMELMLFHFHSADHLGIEGHYHLLLQIPILIGLLCVLLELRYSQSVLLTIVRAMSFMLQGSWMFEMGLMLWIPVFVPKGCKMLYGNEIETRVGNATSVAELNAPTFPAPLNAMADANYMAHGSAISAQAESHIGVECSSDMWNMRAKALANLQFNWITAGVLIFSACLYAFIASRSATHDVENTLPQRKLPFENVNYETVSELNGGKAAEITAIDEEERGLLNHEQNVELPSLRQLRLKLDSWESSSDSHSQESETKVSMSSTSPPRGTLWSYHSGEVHIGGFPTTTLSR